MGVASADLKGAMVEINAETEFVGRNEQFQGLVETLARIALDVGEDLEKLRTAPYPGSGRSVAEELTSSPSAKT